MLTDVFKALIKQSKLVSFYKKNSVIIILSKIKIYIFNTKLLFMNSLISAPKAQESVML